MSLPELTVAEYLIKQYLQTSEPIYLTMWQEAVTGIQKHLIIPTTHAKLSIVAELPNGIGGPLSPKMDHLVCFLPGALALGATNGLPESDARRLPTWTTHKTQQMALARELTKTCWGMYKVTQTGIAPEIIWFSADTGTPGKQCHSSSSTTRTPRSSNAETAWKQELHRQAAGCA